MADMLNLELMTALQAILPREDSERLAILVSVLRDAISQRITTDEARARLANNSNLSPILHLLAGRELQLSKSVVSFGAGNQSGDISIENAAGRDIIKLAFSVNQTVVSSEQAYDVRGLANPYLGLRSFTYDDQARFAGRERLVNEIIKRIGVPNTQCTLLFVTGASGSGKTSVVQAGLIPALQKFYAARNFSVKYAVVRPGIYPLAALGDGLLQLGLSPTGPFTAIEQYVIGLVTSNSEEHRVSLLLIDQFEEIFDPTCDVEQRDILIMILSKLPLFKKPHIHVIITLRSDFLPDLFRHSILYDNAKQGIDLRAMNVNELCAAIERPLQHAHSTKRFEKTLLNRLAADAAEDAAYLPLLQVTLEDIFRQGNLTVGTYHSLIDALRERADAVQDYLDYDGDRRLIRPENDRILIMSIFLDLIRAALDGDPRRDMRVRQPLISLLYGDEIEQQRRLYLIRELCAARLLSASAELPITGEITDTMVEINIIHESLITRWDRLRIAILQRRSELQLRARFELHLLHWLKDGKPEEDLLTGKRLDEAELLAKRNDVIVRHNIDARELLQRSQAQRDSVQQQKFEQARILAREQERRSLGDDSSEVIKTIIRGIILLSRTASDSLSDSPQVTLQLLHELRRAAWGALGDVDLMRDEFVPNSNQSKAVFALIRKNIAHLVGPKNENVTVVLPTTLSPLSFNVLQTLLRAIREAVINAAEHANASEITIRLVDCAPYVCLEVTDNGCGFDTDAPMRQGHRGLNILRDRAEAMSGSLTIESAPNKGTHLKLMLPSSKHLDYPGTAKLGRVEPNV